MKLRWLGVIIVVLGIVASVSVAERPAEEVRSDWEGEIDKTNTFIEQYCYNIGPKPRLDNAIEQVSVFVEYDTGTSKLKEGTRIIEIRKYTDKGFLCRVSVSQEDGLVFQADWEYTADNKIKAYYQLAGDKTFQMGKFKKDGSFKVVRGNAKKKIIGKRLISYTSRGKVAREIINRDGEGELRLEFTYNPEGLLAKEVYLTPDKNSNSKWEFTYTKAGNILEEKIFQPLDHYIGGQKYLYKMVDGKERLVQKDTIPPGKKTPDSRRFYTYSESGKLEKWVVRKDDGRDVSEAQFKYNEKGQLLHEEFFVWVGEGEERNRRRKTMKTYSYKMRGDTKIEISAPLD